MLFFFPFTLSLEYTVINKIFKLFSSATIIKTVPLKLQSDSAEGSLNYTTSTSVY